MYFSDSPLLRSKMDEFEREDGSILGSLLLEPLVMGAGGMIFIDPLFQRVLVQVNRERAVVASCTLLLQPFPRATSRPPVPVWGRMRLPALFCLEMGGSIHVSKAVREPWSGVSLSFASTYPAAPFVGRFLHRHRLLFRTCGFRKSERVWPECTLRNADLQFTTSTCDGTR